MTKQVLFFILITLCMLTSCGDNIDIRQGDSQICHLRLSKRKRHHSHNDFCY